MLQLVLTHGRDQKFAIARTEAREWEDALRQGLERAGAPYHDEIPISFAFYGDLWRPDTPGGVDARETASAADHSLRLELAIELAATAGVRVRKRKSQAEMGLWDPLAAIIGALDDKFGVGEAILQKFLTDVAEYFRYDRLRNNVIDRVAQRILAAKGPVILLGHSLGSIVGYDLLMRRSELPVHALVSFGSPIGTATCRKHVANGAGKTPFPPKVPRWVNLYYREDIATVVRLLAPLFPSGDERSVEDHEIAGRPAGLDNIAGGHDPLIYLSSMVMGKSVRAVVDAWNATNPESAKARTAAKPTSKARRVVSRAQAPARRKPKGGAKARAS